MKIYHIFDKIFQFQFKLISKYIFFVTKVAPLIALFTFGNLANLCFSQRNCGSDNYYEKIIESIPLLEGRYGEIMQDSASVQKIKRLVGNITIPVVVHIIFNNDEQNLSDEQIKEQIKIINDDFAGINGDVIKIPTPFGSSFSENCEIQFELKEITRTKTYKDKFLIKLYENNRRVYKPNYEPVKFSNEGGKDGFSCREYLNIWVANISDNSSNQLLGYGSFPGGLCEYDGVVIYYQCFGKTNYPKFNKGRTLTHEIGHWLNLRHIWGDNSCGDDFIYDTPTQERSNKGCPIYPHISCNNYPNGEMFMNYMDYVNDECMCMFTKGQKERMRSLFIEGGNRAYFLKSDSGNVSILRNDSTRRDLLTPIVKELKNYSINDTNSSAFIVWSTLNNSISNFEVLVKNIKDSSYFKTFTDNNFIRIENLKKDNIYEIEILSIIDSDSVSKKSSPFLFKVYGKDKSSKVENIKFIP